MKFLGVPMVIDPDLPENCVSIRSHEGLERVFEVTDDGRLAERRMIRAGNQLGGSWFRRMIAEMFEGSNQ